MIRELVLNDLPALRDHLLWHSRESGRDGDVVFSPFEDGREVSLESLRAEKERKWISPVSDTGWERAWGIFDGERVVGELKLVPAIPVPSALHRARLMMGIERSHRGQGWGSRLMQAALDWAGSQPSLEVVELGVFENNFPARALYRKFGFVETARTVDCFRVHGMKITDIRMELMLRKRGAALLSVAHAVPGSIHHVEVNVSDVQKSKEFWGWLLGSHGYDLDQEWEQGFSLRQGNTYLVFVQVEKRHQEAGFHRGRAGLNHLAFHADSREQVDSLTNDLERRGIPVLYRDRHPHAGGPDHYAVFFEDPDRIKVEWVALNRA